MGSEPETTAAHGGTGSHFQFFLQRETSWTVREQLNRGDVLFLQNFAALIFLVFLCTVYKYYQGEEEKVADGLCSCFIFPNVFFFKCSKFYVKIAQFAQKQLQIQLKQTGEGLKEATLMFYLLVYKT